MMFDSTSRRLDRHDEGFTLIELMVVVLIIAILLAVAIPTFLGAKKSANSRAAESDLHTGLLAEQAYFTGHQVFDGSATDMSAQESSLNWTVNAPRLSWPSNTVDFTVQTNNATDDTVILQDLGKDKLCYTTLVVSSTSTAGGGLTAGTYHNVSKVQSNGNCPNLPYLLSNDTAVSSGSASANIGTSDNNFYGSW